MGKLTREEYMHMALELARRAFGAGEVPVGAIVVDREGLVIGEGHNRCESSKTAVAHAEIEAITAASLKTGDWRLDGCTIVTTLEPCPMCAGAIINSRVSAIVYGAKDHALGCCGTILNLFEERFPHHPAIYGGVLESECSELLRSFFDRLRRM